MNTSSVIYLGLTMICWSWLVFMLAAPKQWARVVDRENDFWAKTGILPARLIERVKQMEKGRALKFLATLAALAGTIQFALTLFLHHHHR